MKYIMMLILAFATMGFSRDVPDSMLTADQLTKLNASVKVENAKANVEVAKGYIGLGHEVGVAVNDAMSAITEQANKFAGTEVGRMVKWIIIYKICKGLILGLFTIVLTWAAIIAGLASLYFFYVRKNKGETFGGETDNLTRGDLWMLIAVIAISIGVIATWITLGSIT